MCMCVCVSAECTIFMLSVASSLHLIALPNKSNARDRAILIWTISTDVQ